MRMNKIMGMILVCGLVLSSGAFGKTAEEETPALIQALTKQLIAKQRVKVAALDFTDIQGRPNELGRFLAEQLAVDMVTVEGITVIDRANINSIMAEHQLTAEGLVKPENAKKLGQFAGVDAILTGNLAVMDNMIVLTVKGISTETAEVVAAGRMKFDRTKDNQQLLSRAVSGSTASSSGTAPQASSSTAGAIATKDIGSLRCTLLSVMPQRDQKPKRIRGMCEAPDLSGMIPSIPGSERPERAEPTVVIGMACSCELVNTDRSKAISVACNGRAFSSGSLAVYPRGSLTDSAGIVWQLGTLRGLSIVAGGYDENPVRICSLIRYVVPTDNVSEYNHRTGYWYGDFTTIPPGKSIRVTLYFSCLNANNTMRGDGTVPVAFSLETELVMGTHEAEGTIDARRIPWSLENLVIDRVNVQGDGN